MKTSTPTTDEHSHFKGKSVGTDLSSTSSTSQGEYGPQQMEVDDIPLVGAAMQDFRKFTAPYLLHLKQGACLLFQQREVE